MDVLIVDNEPAFAELLAARLELQGYSARSAGSGEEATWLFWECILWA